MLQISCFFSFFAQKKAENDYFDQRLGCAAPKRWLKYSTSLSWNQFVFYLDDTLLTNDTRWQLHIVLDNCNLWRVIWNDVGEGGVVVGQVERVPVETLVSGHLVFIVNGAEFEDHVTLMIRRQLDFNCYTLRGK